MNRSIRRIAVALGVLLVALFVNLNWVQVVKGSDYRDNPSNRRVLLNEYASPRGQIIVDGSPIARSKQTTDELKYLRVYPYGKEYAPVTGYYSFVYGKTGIESAEDGVLSGSDSRLVGTRLADLLTGRNPRGGSVELTLDKAAQDAAFKAMGNRSGAVVAMDPTTGAILAMVSTPSFDPNALASHSANTVTNAYQRDLDAKNNPMTNRATSALYPPGSVFKVIVSAAALKEGLTPSSTISAPNAYWPFQPKRTSACPASLNAACIENFEGETCENGTTATLDYAFAKSCNTAFAKLAVGKLGGTAIANEAKLFGFDAKDPLSIPLSVVGSTVGTRQDLSDDGALAQSAFGQRDVRMTPLEGAMIASAVANDGRLMTPYLVSRELTPSVKVIGETHPSLMSTVLDPTTDAELQQMMLDVVTKPEGTGGPANITDLANVSVYGKTGTADVGETSASKIPPDAWFSGYATQNGTPKIAVAVVIEHGGVNGNETTGGLAAGPVAKAVMEAYLKANG